MASYYKLMFNKRGWNSCFIKYQTLASVYGEVLNCNPFIDRDCILLLTVSKADFCSQFLYLDKLQNIEFIP